jgi:hypothetical protein
MTQLIVNDNINICSDSENEEVNEDDLNNYRGYFHEQEETEEKYFEHGAHFPYKYLVKKLEEILKIEPIRREPVEIRNKSSDRNKIIGRNTFSKNGQLNVTDNFSSILKNSIKSRNQAEARPADKTPIVKTTLSKQLTIGKKVASKNMYISYSNEINANSTSKNKKDKFTFEKFWWIRKSNFFYNRNENQNDFSYTLKNVILNYNSKTSKTKPATAKTVKKPKYNDLNIKITKLIPDNQTKSFDIVVSGLNEMITTNTKSRNNKPNLVNVKSGLFHSEKLNMNQSGSFSKNQLYTHNIVTKQINLIKTIPKPALSVSKDKKLASSVVIASPSISSPTQPLYTEDGKKYTSSKYNVFIKKNLNSCKNSTIKGKKI